MEGKHCNLEERFQNLESLRFSEDRVDLSFSMHWRTS